MGFTKLDSRIIDSSIWDEDSNVLKVFIAFWTKCNPEGIVDATYNAMYRTANLCDKEKKPLPVEAFDNALQVLLNPDPNSRSKENEGRRIQRLDESKWLVTTYADHREFTYSDNPEAVKKRKQRGTSRDIKGHVPNCLGHSVSVSESSSEIFNYWISNNNLIKHTSITKMMIEYINLRLQEYSLETLKKCIDNYNLILSDSKKYWYSYKHSLDEFFRNGDRKPAPYLKFLPERFVESNFLRNQNGFEKNDPEDDGIVWQ